MVLALTLFAAVMTQLGDLAKVVEADTMPSTRDFCVTGTVSYVLVYQDRLCHVIVEDDDVGVDITGSFRSCPQPLPKPGDIIRLDGNLATIGPNRIQPQFTGFAILGHAESPRPAEGKSADIMGGRYDFRRAFLTGELRDVEPSGSDPCWNYLSIIDEGRQYYVPIPTLGAALPQLESLVGSTVRLDGFPDSHNCSFRFLDERRFMVAGLDCITILAPPPKDPFDGAPSVEKLHKLPAETLPRLGRHRAIGHLLTVWQSRNALLRMPDGRIALVDFSEATSLSRGQAVEIIGYPSTDGFTLSLSRAIGRPTGGKAADEPSVRELSDDDMANRISAGYPRKSSLQGLRVRIDGTIADFGNAQREIKTLPLSVAGRLLDVDFSSAQEALGSIVPGCRVRVAGTCVLATENWSAISSGTKLSGIRLVVDHASDLTILARPSWWTPVRLTAAIAILVLVIAVILVWNSQLRRLSEKRRRELFRERAASALAEQKKTERTRLAVEIHDSISQILTGAAMQLDAGETNAAKRILASCRRELRACLWDLRSRALDAENFADAVRETLAPNLGGRNAVVDIDIPSSAMSEGLRHAALCIMREAAVNAVRHGKAGTVAVSGELDGRRLTFSVVDDGRGFDPANARDSKDGHFGILGMKERAKAFSGSVTISSSPEAGTEVSVVLKDNGESMDGRI